MQVKNNKESSMCRQKQHAFSIDVLVDATPTGHFSLLTVCSLDEGHRKNPSIESVNFFQGTFTSQASRKVQVCKPSMKLFGGTIVCKGSLNLR